MAKIRLPIPDDIAATALFQADRTCCVCRERGKPVQIHHIDDDPSNNDPNNLVVLCLHCHNETQTRGSFGRKLDASQLVKFRADWIARVEARRHAADQIAAAHQAPPIEKSPALMLRREVLPNPEKLINYIRTLPAIRRDAYSRAKPLWDTGITPKQKQGCYDVSDVLEQILATLASWYPPRHFDDREPAEYFNEVTASRFNWHRAHLEPNGIGTGGTIVGPLVANAVMIELETMIVDLVSSLSMHLADFDHDQWSREWEAVDDYNKRRLSE